MAKYNISNNHNSKRAITIKDCNEGDIISLDGTNLFIISDDCDCEIHHVYLINLENGNAYEVQENTACQLYTGTLEFDRKDFKEFCE